MEEFRRKMLDSNDVYAQDNNIIVDNSEQSDENGIKTKGLKLNDNLDFNNVHIKGTLEIDGKSTFNGESVFKKDVKTENNAHFIDNGNTVVSQIEESIEKVEPERETKDDYNLYAIVDVDKEGNKIKFYYSKFAPLDNNNLIPSSFLPSYVDDIIEVSNFYTANGTEIKKGDETSIKVLFSGNGDDGTVYTKQKGVSGKIYIFNTENGSVSKNQVSIYRWSGTQFVEIADFDALEKWCKDNLVNYSVVENNNGEIKYILKSTNDNERGSISFKGTNGSNLTYDKNKNQIIVNVEYSGDNWIEVNNSNKTIKHKTHSATTETIESSNDTTLIGPNGQINIPSVSFDSNGHKSGSSSKTVNMVGLATDKNDGFMSKEDKGKINNIVEGANYYEAKMIMSNSNSGTQLSASDSNAYINFVESYKNPKDTVKTENHIDTSVGFVAGNNVTIVGTLNNGKGIITFNGYDTTIKAGSNTIPTDETVNVLNSITENKNGFDREYNYGTVTVLTSKGVASLIGKIDYIDGISFANNKIEYTKKVSTTPVTIMTFKGEGGISVDTSNKVLTIKHSNTKILAGNDKINATEITPVITQLTIPYLSYDEYGHISGKVDQTIKLSDFASKSSLVDYAKKTDLEPYLKKEDQHDYEIKKSTKGYGLYNEDGTLKGVEIDLTPYAKEISLNSYTIKATDKGYGLYDKTDEIQGSEIVLPDLTSYAKKTDVYTYQIKKSTKGYSLYDNNNAIQGTEIVIPKSPDLTPYAKKTDLEPYAKKEDVHEYEIKTTTNGYGLYDEDSNLKGAEIKIPAMPDLTPYAKKTDLNNYNYYNSDLVISNSNTGTFGKTATSSDTYVNLIETNKAGTKTVKKSIRFMGDGQTSVKSNGSQIIVTSQQNPDDDTKYSMTVGSGQTINNEKVEVNPRLQLIENNNSVKSTSVMAGADWVKTYSNGNTDISIAHKKVIDMNETVDAKLVKVGVDDYGHVVTTEEISTSDIYPYVQNMIPEYSIIENPNHQGYYYLTDGVEQKGSEFKVDNQILRIKASGGIVAGYDGTEVKEVDIAGSGSIVVTSPRAGSIVIKGTDTVYTLPTASSSILGGVKIGNNITIASDGTISVEKPIYYEGAVTDYGTITINDKTISLSQAVGKINDTTNRGEVFNDYEHNVASGAYSHSEGRKTQALARNSHAEGLDSICTEDAQGGHAEGNSTVIGLLGHAEGAGTIAGNKAHAEGINSVAKGRYSHAQNNSTIANSESQTALGKYNIEDTNGKYSVIIGNGDFVNDSIVRSNMFTADWNGVMTSYGDTSDYVLQNTDGSTISLRNLVLSSGDKSTVSYIPTVTSGTELGKLTIDNVNYSIYMPSTSGVVTSTTYKNNITDVKKTVIGTITVSGSTNYNVSIPTISNLASYREGLSIGSSSYGDVTTSYYVPYATSSSYGLVKAGTNTTISNGVISSTDTKYTLNLSGQNLSLINSNTGTTVKTIALPQASVGNLVFTDGNHSVYYDGTTSTIKLGGGLSVDNTNNQINAKNTTYSLNKANNTYTLTDSDGTNKGSITIPTSLKNPNSLIVKNSKLSAEYNGESTKTIVLGSNIDFTYNSSSNNYTLNAKNTTYNIKATTNGYGLYSNSNVMQGSEIVIPKIPDLTPYAKKSEIVSYKIKKTNNGYGLYDSSDTIKGEEIIIPNSPDLTPYVKKPELEPYAKKEDISDYVIKATTKGYGLYDDKNILKGAEIVIPKTPDLSSYVKKTELPNETLTFTDSIETSFSYSPNEAKTLRFGTGMNFYQDEDGIYNLESYNDTYTMRKTTNGYGLYNSYDALVGTEIVMPNLSNYATKSEVGITSIQSSGNNFGKIGVSTSGHTATLSLAGSPIWYDSSGTIRLAPNITGSNPTVAFGERDMTIVQKSKDTDRKESIQVNFMHLSNVIKNIYDILYDLCAKHNVSGSYSKYYNKATKNCLDDIPGALSDAIERTLLN
mgnify:CR=1 FL=1